MVSAVCVPSRVLLQLHPPGRLPFTRSQPSQQWDPLPMEEMKYLELYLDQCAHQVSPNCRHCPKGETRVPTLELSTTSCALRALPSFSLIWPVRGGLDYPSFSWKIEASREEITCPMLPARSRTWFSANPEPRLYRPIPILKTHARSVPLCVSALLGQTETDLFPTALILHI